MEQVNDTRGELRLSPNINVTGEFQTAVKEFIQSVKSGEFKAGLVKELNRHAKSNVLSLMGFRNAFGRWEIDNCNGRAGNSVIGDYIKQTAQPIIEKWVTKKIKSLENWTLPKKAVDSLNEEMNREIIYGLRNRLQEIIQEKLKAAEPYLEQRAKELFSAHIVSESQLKEIVRKSIAGEDEEVSEF
jgi:hypothetical protein